jgi:Zn-dependent peptidase ImmA (M78 family)
MQNSTNHPNGGRSVLASLRQLVPNRSLLFTESLRIAELQANRLIELTGDDPSGLDQRIAGLPRIQVVYRQLPTSGMSYWSGDAWVICLNRDEPETRQRFTLLHEYKHILDHGRAERLFTGTRNRSPEQQAEHAADYFAGCALMPKRLLKSAWGNGIQHRRDLAELFDVSERAIEVRLAQLGIGDNEQRCALPGERLLPTPGRRRYFRQRSVDWSKSFNNGSELVNER